MSEEFNMPVSVAKLRTEMFSTYLLSRGWKERHSDQANRVYFEGAIHEGGQPYKLYLPVSRNVPKYRTLLQRAVYFLCEVEDREPREIIPEILEAATQPAAEGHSPESAAGRRIRVRNSAASPLQLVMKSRSGQHQLMPGECIELIGKSDTLDIEQTDTALIIDDRAIE